MKLYLVTTNENKVEEFQSILGPEFEVEQLNVDYPELRSDDVRDIVEIAAKSLAENLQKTIIVEDSGLFVSALKDFPGTCTAYVTKRIGNKGILKLMKGVKDRTCFYKSAVGYCEPGKEPVSFHGIKEGKMAKKEKGTQGWGQDPIFIPKGYKNTYAELGYDIKNQTSHRRISIEKLKEYLENNKI